MNEMAEKLEKMSNDLDELGFPTKVKMDADAAEGVYLVFAKIRAPNGTLLEVYVELDQEKGRKLFTELTAEQLLHGQPVVPPGLRKYQAGST